MKTNLSASITALAEFETLSSKIDSHFHSTEAFLDAKKIYLELKQTLELLQEKETVLHSEAFVLPEFSGS